MIQKILLLLSFIVALLFPPIELIAQDSTKLVILSSRVGVILELKDRDYYHLFQNINGFKRAIIVKTMQGTFHAIIEYQSANGIACDTLIQYPESFILMLAEKINHYEQLAKEEYRMGSDPPSIDIVAVKDSAAQSLISKIIIHNYTSETKSFSNNEKVFPNSLATKPLSIKEKLVSNSITTDESKNIIYEDTLPFANNTKQFLDENFHYVGLGISLATYSPDYSGINNAIRAVEDQYINQGYSIGSYSLNINFSPLIFAHLKIRLKNSFAITLNAVSSSSGDQASFHAVTAELLYSFKLFGNESTRLFTGLGIGQYSFSIARSYGNWSRISPTDPSGSYTYLKDIKFAGTKIGWHYTTGFEYLLSPSVGVTLFANFITVPAIEATNTNEITASIKLGSTSLGVQMMIYF